MRVHLKLTALRESNWHEQLSRFVLGGAITVMTGLLAKQYGPVIGGLFLAFPAIFPASATLVEKHERDKKQRAGIAHTSRGRLSAALDARGAAMGSLALGVFAVLVWKLLPANNAALILVAALALWIGLATLIWRLRKLHVYSTRRKLK
jgi:Protein of unknown function (DUF3147)